MVVIVDVLAASYHRNLNIKNHHIVLYIYIYFFLFIYIPISISPLLTKLPEGNWSH